MMESIGSDFYGSALQDVVRSVAAGDSRALVVLFNSAGAMIRAIARRRLRSHEDAEEVALDVFSDVWSHAGSYDSSRGSVMAWLAVMARNKSIDRLRQRRNIFSEEQDTDKVVCGSHGPEDRLFHAQTAHLLQAALDTLPPLRRRVVVLAFFEGRSHVEIAADVSIPLGSVKSHARRALISLRGKLSMTN